MLIYNSGLFSDQVADSQVAWRLSIYTDKADVSRLYYINAVDGSIIKQLDNSPEAEQRETYVLSDCWDSIGTLTYDETGLVSTYDEQAEIIDEYSNQVYDYYYANFERDSYDNNGAIIESYAHYSEMGSLYPLCDDYDNAVWEPDLRIMRYGEDFLSLDISGHEFTHGVIQYSVGSTSSDTLEYENESGALNESYADIFGELIEFENSGGDWMIGTDLSSGPSRDMSDPNSSSYWQPSHTGEMYELAEGESVECDDTSPNYNDCGWIHYNSGITNNALYLLINGGTNPYSGDGVATGIGREAAEQIYYRALTTYLDTASDFSDAYNATMQSCLDLYTTDSTTYPLSYCESVFDAFAAVGINTDTFYTVDTTGNTSTGVATTKLLKSPAPTALNLTAGNTTIAATWTASSATASTVGGYIIYYGTSKTALTNTINVGTVTNYTIPGLTNGTKYFVAVSAYNTAGTESPVSLIKWAKPRL